MSNPKIATLFVIPLCIAAACYFGYKILDVVLLKRTHGQMTVLLKNQPEQKVSMTLCRTLDRDDSQLIISDKSGNGMIVYKESDVVTNLVPIFQNKKLDVSQIRCTVLRSNLALASFRPGRRGDGSIQSWKGSIEGQCEIPNGDIAFTADIHACQ